MTNEEFIQTVELDQEELDQISADVEQRKVARQQKKYDKVIFDGMYEEAKVVNAIVVKRWEEEC